MDIPNLSSQPENIKTESSSFSLPIIIGIILISLMVGFGLSRAYPSTQNKMITTSSGVVVETKSTDSISNADQLQAGTLYGSADPNCKDNATGTIAKGSINGEGTHILNRPGGADQRASLTSSAVDLDLLAKTSLSPVKPTLPKKLAGY